jgi:uncharacterized protein (TIGR03086 family)
MRSAPIHAPPLLESLGLLERAVGYARLALQDVRPSQLGNPTPCAGWGLDTLLVHMVDSLEALTEAADLGHVTLVPSPVPSPGPRSPVGSVERLRVLACSLLGSWSEVARDDDVMVGDRRLVSSVVACAGALEVAVHGWDVSWATGAHRPLPAPLARDLLPWVDVFVTDGDRPSRFGPALGVPMGGPSSRLLALLGRSG